MLLQKLARFFSTDIGIDLGTANCLVYVKGPFLCRRLSYRQLKERLRHYCTEKQEP